ncbi:MAG TPA: glycosyltransferase [Myxococcaceae bacterium]|nr:glycosyltransferase [Myxococcaceae bacterium]
MNEARAAREVASFVPGSGGPVLQLSMRRVHDLVAFCAPYEFEDVVASVTGADRIEITNYPAIEWARRAYKLGRKALRSRALARRLVPRLPVPRLDREYELFFPVFNHPFELFALAAVPDWRARCKRAVCLVSEIWIQELPEYLIELLAEFDQLFIALQHPAAEVARIVGKPCTYLPLAADVCRFSPHPNPAPRSIDVCNLGRRSAVTHAALLELARERRIFYFHDTVKASGPRGKQMTFHVGNPAEHRQFLASVLRRSRYYLAYRSRVNEPEQTEGREEISGRFYEGAAAGAVLLGEPPRSEEFGRQFDWPEAVVRLPFDSPDVGDFLARLDREPERLEQIARTNARQAALRHDWLHRLEQVFAAVGLAPTEGMRARRERLSDLARLAGGEQAGAGRTVPVVGR